jgi:adenosylhomocysteine nucleosidase
LDADRVTSGRPPAAPIAACASAAEARAARRAGFRTAVVGIGASRGVPAGRIVSFGVAGGLRPARRLEVGKVIDATRIVDEEGHELWAGEGLGIPGAHPGTILAIDRIADDPTERRRLRKQTGADAVDMESGILAATGRLDGCVRAVSDTPERPLGPLAEAVTPSGRPRLAALAKALALAPKDTVRALGDVRTALRSLASAFTGGESA